MHVVPTVEDNTLETSPNRRTHDQQWILATLTLLFLFAANNLYGAACSNASLKGTYGYSAQGFVEVTPDINPTGFVPFAQNGLVVNNGKGNSSGTLTYSTTAANGGSFTDTFTVSYAINPDCSGKAQVKASDGAIFHFNLVVLGPDTYTFISTDPNGFLGIYTAKKITGGNPGKDE